MTEDAHTTAGRDRRKFSALSPDSSGQQYGGVHVIDDFGSVLLGQMDSLLDGSNIKSESE